jgi:hypothetical protein
MLAQIAPIGEDDPGRSSANVRRWSLGAAARFGAAVATTTALEQGAGSLAGIS